ncbi:Fic family protein [Helcobacillus sp. ACRRO]|uniref:type II toxin-antitoxin system death-on-curing family toxin n=1 Tax=Helcobacillus TaxID=1161125 RepID=UPI001EF5CB01|nr:MULTISPECIES: Fic family protein [Helcobacillus]MCG7427862.1 Fic family protein [Helcobacillus sp. ACRRO]MDK7741674.1 Fic family protein [Helcobacillus massiliensis]WOO92717.1 Fic family protein [Helcobacillus massiliensis]
MTQFLDLVDLLGLIDDLDVGPIRDLGLLEAAAVRPTTTLWGNDVYPTEMEKTAALLESLVCHRPLVDGNKRLGFLAVHVFLGLNGWDLVAPDDDAYDLVIGVAEGRLGMSESAELLATRCVRDGAEGHRR